MAGQSRINLLRFSLFGYLRLIAYGTPSQIATPPSRKAAQQSQAAKPSLGRWARHTLGGLADWRPSRWAATFAKPAAQAKPVSKGLGGHAKRRLAGGETTRQTERRGAGR